YARALGEDFPVFRDAKVDVRNRLTRTSHAVVGIVGRQNWGSFCKAVALIDGDAHGPEKLGKLFRERCAAGKNEPQLSACSLANLRVDQLVSQFPGELYLQVGVLFSGTPQCRTTCDGHRPSK